MAVSVAIINSEKENDLTGVEHVVPEQYSHPSVAISQSNDQQFDRDFLLQFLDRRELVIRRCNYANFLRPSPCKIPVFQV